MQYLAQQCFRICLGILALLATADIANAEPRAGHYYLSGVQEVGSELLLNEDGTYQWFLSYGAQDQKSQGTWQEKDQKVILITKAQKPSRPFLSLKGTEPWSQDAAQNLEDAEQKNIDDKVYAFCPFINHQPAVTDGQPAQQPQAAEAETAPMAEPTEDASTLEKESKLAIAELPKMTSEFHVLRVNSRADVDAFQNEKPGSVSWANASNALLDKVTNYKTAEEKLRKTIVRAAAIDEKYRDILDSDDLHNPLLQYGYLKCSQTIKALTTTTQKPHVALLIDDPENELHITDTSKAQFHFSDGTVQSVDRFQGGYAIVGLEPGKSVSKISVDFSGDDESQNHHADFDVKVENQSVIHVLMDVSALIPTAFETLELPIEDGALTYHGGKYTKQ